MTVSDAMNLLLNLLNMLLIILILAHWSACVFLIAGLYMSETQGQSWLSYQDYQDLSRMEQYVNALYFSITTMCTIGYGDIRPVTSPEYLVVIGLELVAGIFFAYILGKIGSPYTWYNLLAESCREKQ